MSIKLVTLMSTERIVGDLYEVRFRHMPEAVAGYMICKPQVISMTKSLPSQGLDQSNEPEFRIAFTPWNPFSKFDTVRLNPNAIINITDVREDIEKIYLDEFHVENPEILEDPIEFLYYDDPSLQNEVQR